MVLGELFTVSLDGAVIRLSAEVGREVHHSEVSVNLKFDGDITEAVVTVEHVETRISAQYKGGKFASIFRSYDGRTAIMPLDSDEDKFEV